MPDVPAPILARRLADFREACRAAGLRLTGPKLAIYRTLAGTDEHPTARGLFAAVRAEIPDLSFATVYKNLELFARHGLIRELDFGEGATRFDAEFGEHHHIFDSGKLEVRDVFLPAGSSVPLPVGLDPSLVRRVEVTYVV